MCTVLTVQIYNKSNEVDQNDLLMIFTMHCLYLLPDRINHAGSFSESLKKQKINGKQV
jgi:hypothetical protein